MKLKSMVVMSCGVLTLASCSKDEVEGTQVDETIKTRAYEASVLEEYYHLTEIPKNDEFASFYHESTESRTQTFMIPAGIPFNIVGDQGTILTAEEGNWIDNYGEHRDGDVRIELIEVFSKADMVLLDKATSGISEDGDFISALSSGGEIFVNASIDGDNVELDGRLNVKVPTDSPDFDMVKFVEVDGVEDDLLWRVADDKELEIEEEDKEREGAGFTTSFNILPGEWGWTNIDKWVVDPCSKTDIFVDVPAGYDPSNTEVYLSYDGDPGRLANFDTWDSGAEMFTEHYGQICLGLDCHIIAVTNVGGSLEYAIHGTTIVPGHIEVFTGFTPISEAALIAAIDALP